MSFSRALEGSIGARRRKNAERTSLSARECPFTNRFQEVLASRSAFARSRDSCTCADPSLLRASTRASLHSASLLELHRVTGLRRNSRRSAFQKISPLRGLLFSGAEDRATEGSIHVQCLRVQQTRSLHCSQLASIPLSHHSLLSQVLLVVIVRSIVYRSRASNTSTFACPISGAQKKSLGRVHQKLDQLPPNLLALSANATRDAKGSRDTHGDPHRPSSSEKS